MVLLYDQGRLLLHAQQVKVGRVADAQSGPGVGHAHPQGHGAVGGVVQGQRLPAAYRTNTFVLSGLGE
jgi:hypothetical protein